MTLKATLDVCRWLKTEVRRRGLKHSSRLSVAHAIGHRIDARGECWPSLDTLAEDAMLGRKTVQRALDDLERVGLVTRQRRGGGRYGAGGRGVTTVYGLPGFVALLAEHRRKVGHGDHVSDRKVSHGVPNGARKVGHGDQQTVRSSINGKIGSRELALNVNGNLNGEGEPERCPRTADLFEDVADRVERDRTRAVGLIGSKGLILSDGAVRALLAEHDARAAGG